MLTTCFVYHSFLKTSTLISTWINDFRFCLLLQLDICYIFLVAIFNFASRKTIIFKQRTLNNFMLYMVHPLRCFSYSSILTKCRHNEPHRHRERTNTSTVTKQKATILICSCGSKYWTFISSTVQYVMYTIQLLKACLVTALTLFYLVYFVPKQGRKTDILWFQRG